MTVFNAESHKMNRGWLQEEVLKAESPTAGVAIFDLREEISIGPDLSQEDLAQTFRLFTGVYAELEVETPLWSNSFSQCHQAGIKRLKIGVLHRPIQCAEPFNKRRPKE
jgi:hypothetical protein